MANHATLFSATLGEDKKIEPPLGPLYIAAALEHVGWSVDFRDYQLVAEANAFDPAIIADYLEGHAAIVMISCYVDMLPVVIGAAEIIKARRPGTYVLIGGPGPSAGSLDLVKTFTSIDAIVIGEGEETIKEWARARAAWDNGLAEPGPIAGMIHRTANGEVVEGGIRKRIGDLQSSRPAYHLVDWSHYSTGRIITTRGCPYHCSFCDVAPLWGRKAVYRDVASTVEEVILLRDRYGRKGIAIADDTFVLNRERVRAFCELMIEKRVGVEWGCFGRINLMSEELIALMAKAGCRSIFYGIDSGSPRILDQTLKELDSTSILPTLEISSRYFEFIEASFIWGYPFETLEDFMLTLQMASDASLYAPKVNVQLHMLSPLPSSPAYHDFEGELENPEPADGRWLLLPGLLLDQRAAAVRQIIARRPSLFPGFHTFPTPDKAAKRERLEEVLTALDRMLGRTMLDGRVYSLLSQEDDALERALLLEAAPGPARIGAGLALGAFKRSRVSKRRTEPQNLVGERPAAMVRQRNDAPVFRII